MAGPSGTRRNPNHQSRPAVVGVGGSAVAVAVAVAVAAVAAVAVAAVAVAAVAVAIEDCPPFHKKWARSSRAPAVLNGP